VVVIGGGCRRFLFLGEKYCAQSEGRRYQWDLRLVEELRQAGEAMGVASFGMSEKQQNRYWGEFQGHGMVVVEGEGENVLLWVQGDLPNLDLRGEC
jgi:hypothetical protein